MTLVKGMASGTAIGAVMLIGLSAPSAQAGYVVDLTQQATDVVATGSGSIDLTGLSSSEGADAPPAGMWPAFGFIGTGPTSNVLLDSYTGATGPESFGSGDTTVGSSGAGDGVVLTAADFGALFVPYGYVSDAPLWDTSTYSGATFTSLGVTPGRYEWTWGTGANQNFTLVIGAPEPSTWAMMLVGFAGLALAGYRARAAATSKM